MTYWHKHYLGITKKNLQDRLQEQKEIEGSGRLLIGLVGRFYKHDMVINLRTGKSNRSLVIVPRKKGFWDNL